ncbi:MAG: hypothetical protein PHD60_00770 [Clostridia bacterium]|nr:hypothetical protein [Clostridia bacterium]
MIQCIIGGVTISTFKKVKQNFIKILLVLVIANIILTAFGIIPKQYMWFFIWFAAAIELMFFFSVFMKLKKIVKCYRITKAIGYSGFESLQIALEEAVPKLVAKLATAEFKLYYTIYLSLKGKANRLNKDKYTSKLNNYSFFLKAIIPLCIVEIVAVNFVIPDNWWYCKMIHLILGVWAILWLIADFNAMKYYTHEFRSNGCMLQMGIRCSKFIPLDLISSVHQIRKVVPEFSLAPVVSKKEPQNLYLSAGENCNVKIKLKEALTFQGLVKDYSDIKQVWLSLEEPEKFYMRVSNILS